MIAITTKALFLSLAPSVAGRRSTALKENLYRATECYGDVESLYRRALSIRGKLATANRGKYGKDTEDTQSALEKLKGENIGLIEAVSKLIK
jgi:hypothetical protein